MTTAIAPNLPVRLDGKVAIVTGANAGIGLGIANVFAAAGASVVIVGRDAGRNAEAVASIEATGGKAIAATCDVTSERDCAAMAQLAVDTFGQIDICVANAGGSVGTTPIQDMSTKEWMDGIALNLHGTFFTFRAVLQHMIPAGRGGALIGMSSAAAVRAPAMPALHYSASKGAIDSMTMSLAVNLGPHGIRVNSIQPGFTSTPAAQARMSDDAFMSAMLSRIPVRRVAQPEDIGYLCLYLASDLSGFVTGQHIGIDGGMTLNLF